MDEELFIPIVFFIATAVVFALYFYYRFRTRSDRQATIRMALDKGTELSPEFLKQLGEAEPSKDRDLRRGLIWLALGVALGLASLAIGEPDATRGMLTGAAFPFAIGVAYMIMWQYGARKPAA